MTTDSKENKLKDVDLDSPIEVIKEFLKKNDYKSTLECFEAEIKYKIINQSSKVSDYKLKIRIMN